MFKFESLSNVSQPTESLLGERFKSIILTFFNANQQTEVINLLLNFNAERYPYFLFITIILQEEGILDVATLYRATQYQSYIDLRSRLFFRDTESRCSFTNTR